MCGRYFIDAKTWKKTRQRFRELLELPEESAAKDILPSMDAPSIVGASSSLKAEPLRWGFPGFDGQKMIINARAESVRERPMFAESAELRRCVLPAAGFYEWDRSRQKVTFTLPEEPVIYLAGIWRPFGTERRFVILTREANASMAPVHDRMPLMIEPDRVRDWLTDTEAAYALLEKPLPSLAAARDYEQLSFFDAPDTDETGE